MTWIRFDRNQYGTQISVHKCDNCGKRFTVCPAIAPDSEGWDGCLAETCDSYDPARDVDLMMESGVELLSKPQPLWKQLFKM